MSGSESAESVVAEAVAMVRAGLAALSQVDVRDLSPATVADGAVELAGVADVVGGELARFGAAMADGGVWVDDGAASPMAWLSTRTAMGWGAARRSVELGAAMAAVPELDTAVRSGAVSPDAAAAVIPAIDDVGFAEVAGDLIIELSGLTPASARRHVETWRAVANPTDDVERRQRAAKGRCLVFRPLDDGMTHVEGVVPSHVARELRNALAALAAQQRLDGTGRTRQQRTVDALGDLTAAFNRGEVTGGRNLPRMIVTATLEQFMSQTGHGVDTLTGDLVPAGEFDRHRCDSIIHRMLVDQSNARLHFGRGRRTASPDQYLTMVARDRGCRHPGCDRPPQWCEAHHLRLFAARGGHTDIDEMVLLCHHHHHTLHDGGWTLTGTPDHLVFTTPDGRTLHSPAPAHDRLDLPRHDTKDVA